MVRLCKVCGVPLSGLRGRYYEVFYGIRPNNKNPYLCNRCAELAPLGGKKLQITVLFADIRGFTRLLDKMPLEAIEGFLNSYFQLASDIFIRHDAVVDKLLGDCAMAIFGAPIVRSDHPRQAVEAAVELQQGVQQLLGGPGAQLPLEVGIGVNTGEALVGNVGSRTVKDWTAIGDMVNVASRLQHLAAPGEVLMTEAVYQWIRELYPTLEARSLKLEGRKDPVLVYGLQF